MRDIAKSGEVVTITQYGCLALMLVSYKEGEELLRLRAAATTMNRHFEGRYRSEDTFEELRSVLIRPKFDRYL